MKLLFYQRLRLHALRRAAGFALLAASTWAFLLTGCSPYTLLNSTTYNNADIRDFTTFRIAKPKGGRLPPHMSMIDYQNISNAIRTQLELRGLREDPESPILANFGLTIKTTLETEPAIPPGFYSPGYWNGFGPWRNYWITPRQAYLQNYYQNAEIITGIERNGVLTIDMVDTKDLQYVWSASVESVLTPGNTQLRNQASIQQIVALAFSKYPIPLPKE
jgi:hypothetical protein